jgi:hypothetical protein
MPQDIREKPYLNHHDVLALSFIRLPGRYFFRRHYRHGLRSHIMEVLDPGDMEKETNGLDIGGVKCFPRARPIKMLRLFRTKFKSLQDALVEIQRVKIIGQFLTPRHIALSDEFLVDYIFDGKRDFILCGLQEYVEGEVLDPWMSIDDNHLACLLKRMEPENAGDWGPDHSTNQWIRAFKRNATGFIDRVKHLIKEAGHIPDLAGAGNLLVTPSGKIKLVDINNISKVTFEPTITTDDKGYPVCDKSIEALSLLEGKLLNRPPESDEALYRTFLEPQRRMAVKEIEKEFNDNVLKSWI